jgi:hypothetical protein
MKRILALLTLLLTLPAGAWNPFVFSSGPDLFRKSTVEWLGRFNSPSLLGSLLRTNIILSRDETDTWSLGARLGNFNVGDAPRIASLGYDIPTNLWDAEIGAAYSHRYADKKSASLNFSVGSASDKPFDRFQETVIQATASYRIPDGEMNSWVFFINFSNNRPFLNYIPLPGFAYAIVSPKSKVFAVLGLPFVIFDWKPAQDWDIKASALGPTILMAQAGYHLSTSTRLYGEVNWNQILWLPSGRLDVADRLYYDEKRAVLGFEFPILDSLKADIAGGIAGGRRFVRGRSILSSSRQQVDLPTSAFANFKLTASF